MRTFKFTVFLAGILLCFSAWAATPNPMDMLQPLSNRMLAALKANRPKLRQNPNYIYTLVDRIILPHVDVLGMSRSVLGRNAWTSATPAEQKAFTKAFTRVVVGTYASALNAYKDETVRFFPMRGSYEGQRRVMIRSQVERHDGPPIPLDYRLALKGNRWVIYDLNVEGVSLLQSFYAQFSSALSQGKTVTQLTRDLQHKNIKQRTR
ncbi:MAG: ABC transporter substrate-binding protein [Gammaproteobacteria bacterium]|nr:ABC transporter substrate-binding protein [Gammaproteobacteria bacterium]MBU1558850.1 ABC transporter substrate-binding protein [Gammaproteobacteria bacterium]MBU1628708.1 ABC transporter substrate-binding protein [Gammaproteobacteria bacterium]MBU1926546.1 ABC transporter substrate-binding protein [Gammaproteobacteria bacterium]MBU2545688.1 ABC transporter substrate-binding protein [Gammaproteobacteria bacterium]